MFCPNCGKENDDTVRHCTACGSFIPDLSVLGSDTASAVSNDQPLTYQALSQENVNELQNDTSRYQEYTMTDVVARKSHKKLIIWLIVIASVLVIGVAAFFTVRWIISSVTLGKIKDDPTKYVLSSYQTTAQRVSDNNDLVRALTAGENQQKTTKTTITANGMTEQQIVSIDGTTKEAYFYQNTEMKPFTASTVAEGKKQLETDTARSQKFTLEGYATMDRLVVKGTQNDKTVDYYVDLNNLRQDALTSAFGPEGENLFHITRENYDMAMDVYEFVYNNLKQDSDPFGLVSLGEKLCDDFDKCGNINVTEEKATIDEVSVNAIVVTHTFNNTDIVTTVFNDLKDWVRDRININESVNKMIEDALAKADIDAALAQLKSSGQLDGVELVLKHYVNKDNALMQTEIVLQKGGQGIRVVFGFGADPATSKKCFLKVATIDAEGHEVVVQTITLTDESTAAEEKYTVSYIGFGVNGSTTFVRNKTTGDFTLTNNMTMPMVSGMMTNDVTLPENSNSPQNFSISGNLKTTEDAITLTYSQPSYDGSDVVIEMTVSATAEIKELTSNNNLLTATSKELSDLFAAGSPVMVAGSVM